MKSVTIRLDMAETVKKFVNIAARYDYEMTLKSGRYVVDAKSILGIFSLDLGEPVVLEIASDDCDDLLAALAPFIA
ncbi:MAG TPA: HPr family phosphocarrier protein [Candidatus Limadaptatus stercoripullorum]|uniref:HPr family phosphocarrier protein n=1 Tax=Candidatus Limadaptatus stercoripullorum TaxID=2840846 RepID=A0A9D1N8Q7_9FIRM|nr:HPr family phosphocarrier protein [Candidatus Limadaptatus stercoripullorum]